MNENSKTTVFVAAAAVVVVLAWFSRPRVRDFDAPPEVVGQTLFDIKPLDVTSLEITQYDEQTGQVKPFKVAQVKDRWSIPSHQNYPADAKDQVVDAATSLTNRTILALVSSSPGDHAQYGVLDPADKSLKAGTTGVGTRVVMRDKDDKTVADLVIGKEVPGDRKGLRYVRTAGEGGNLQDAVFEVEINPDKLSANFGDWIEKDLLKMPSTWDIKQIEIRDYSVDILAGRLRQRGRMAVEHQQSGEPRWKLAEDLAFDGKTGKWVPVKMAPNEELNNEKLDKLRDGLGNLKIVDVERKPPSVSASLVKGAVDQETVSSLGERGFYFVPMGEGKEEVVQLLSTEGEFRVVMNDGVAYTLRFGQTTGSASPDAKKKKEAPKAKPDAKDQQKPESTGLNRYLFVMVDYDLDVIPKPQLEPLPPEPKPGEKKDEKKPEAKSADANKDDAKKNDVARDKPDPKAERERIEKENKKKQEEYDEKVNKAKERVRELNDRFADWYYVISDSVYQDIHLGRKDVVKIKEEKKEEKKEGEQKPAVPTAPKAPAGSPAEFNQMKDALPAPKKEGPAAKKEEPGAKKEPAAEPKKAEPPAAKKETPPAPKAPRPTPPKKAEAPAPKAAAPPAAKK